jgi:hypothetical protein
MAINSTLLGNTGGNIFLCPGSSPNNIQEHAVTCMIFCNTSDQSVTLNLYAAATTVTIGIENQLIKDLEIPAGETLTFDSEKLILSSGDRVFAIASANNRLTASVSSMRVS